MEKLVTFTTSLQDLILDEMQLPPQPHVNQNPRMLSPYFRFTGRQSDGPPSHRHGAPDLQAPTERSNNYQTSITTDASHAESKPVERPWKIERYSKKRMDEASDEQHRQTWQWLFELARQTRKSVEELNRERSGSHGPGSGRSTSPGATPTPGASHPARTGSEDSTSLVKRLENLMALEQQCEGWIREEAENKEESEEQSDYHDDLSPLHECVLHWIRSLRDITEERFVARLEQEQEEEDCPDISSPGSNAFSQHNGPERGHGQKDESDPDKESDGSDESVRSDDTEGFDGSDGSNDSNDSDGSSNSGSSGDSGNSDDSDGLVIFTPSNSRTHSEADSPNFPPPSYALVDKARDIKWFEAHYMKMLEAMDHLEAIGFIRPKEIPLADQWRRELEDQYMLILETLWQVPDHEDGPTQETEDILKSTLALRQQPTVVDDDLADRDAIIRSEEYYRAVMETFRQEKGHKMCGRRYRRFKWYRQVIINRMEER